MFWEERFQTWCIFFFLVNVCFGKKGEFTRLREEMAEGEDERG